MAGVVNYNVRTNSCVKRAVIYSNSCLHNNKVHYSFVTLAQPSYCCSALAHILSLSNSHILVSEELLLLNCLSKPSLLDHVVLDIFVVPAL